MAELKSDVNDGDVVVHKTWAWEVEKTVVGVNGARTTHQIRRLGTLASTICYSDETRKVKAGVEDLPSVETLKQMSYDAMCVEDFMRNGEIAKILNKAGMAYGTIRPECRVDDFTHAEGCSKQRLLEDNALHS